LAAAEKADLENKAGNKKEDACLVYWVSNGHGFCLLVLSARCFEVCLIATRNGMGMTLLIKYCVH